MTQPYLASVAVRLPAAGTRFAAGLACLLSTLGRPAGAGLAFSRSDPQSYPHLFFDLELDRPEAMAEFELSDGERLAVPIANTTSQSWPSPHAYQLLSLTAVAERLEGCGLRPIALDHAGINLPWRGPGVHPRIAGLRERLAPACLYHTYPSGEPWDFILPGTAGEIAGHERIDYVRVRRPKFELVSFDSCSTPLIQLDLAVNAPYERFSPLFPEALNDPQLRNIWLYLENPSGVDVCLVINEPDERDWSSFFKGYRL